MIPAQPKSGASQDLQITVGTVKATDSRAAGGTIERGATHANVHMTPVVWLEDGDGAEHAFEGSSFADARADHKLVVVRKRSNGKLIRMYNLTTQKTIDSNDLIPLKSGPNNYISGTLMLTIVGMLPAIVVYTAVVSFVRESILGRDPRSFDLASHFPYVAVLLVMFCFWLMTKLVARSRAKTKSLSDVVEEAVGQQGLVGHDVP